MNRKLLLYPKGWACVKYFSRWLIFFHDLGLSLLSTLLAALFVSVVLYAGYSSSFIMSLLVVSLFCSIISIFLFKTYKGIIRHSAYTETGRLGLASFLKVVLFYLTLSYLEKIAEPRLSLVLAIDFLLTFYIFTLSRAILILTYRFIVNNSAEGKTNMLVYGLSEKETDFTGTTLPDSLGKYQITGFLSFGQEENLRVGGHTLYSFESEESFQALVKQQCVSSILFLSEHAVKEEAERLVRYCEHQGVAMLLLPPLNEIKNGKLTHRMLEPVKVEDLLGRDEIKIDLQKISDDLREKVVMVTGAAGSIGSEICRQLCAFPIKYLVLFDAAETPMHNLRLELEEKFPDVTFYPVMGDVRNPARVHTIIDCYRPQIIYHAAAYKHVPLMEENPCEAVRTNIFGTRTMADAALQYDVEKFVMISTDKAVNPTNVMGASKRLAEIYVQSLALALKKGEVQGKTRFITTRFGNVLGSNGSVIPRFREQIAKGGPVTVTHPDIIRYFMTIPEACRLVLEAGTMGRGGEIYIFEMGEPVKIVDLAKRMITLAGLKVGQDVEITYTGLRPGEKLYEELLSDHENTLPTVNEKIRIAKVREYCYKEIAPRLAELMDIAHRTRVHDTVRLMKEILPEFVSRNSVYEKIDAEVDTSLFAEGATLNERKGPRRNGSAVLKDPASPVIPAESID